MIQSLLETSDLEVSLTTSEGIKEAQLQKLVVNSVVNPLTAVLRCRTGELFQDQARRALVHELLKETGHIIRGIQQGGANKLVDLRFADEDLLVIVEKSSKRVGGGRTSMLQDVEVGRRTEIDYMNGYLISQAKQLGLSCAHNTRLVDFVKQGRTIQNNEIWSLFTPMVEA
jgi:2-dehydropantoate 2-reductase